MLNASSDAVKAKFLSFFSEGGVGNEVDAEGFRDFRYAYWVCCEFVLLEHFLNLNLNFYLAFP